jgi:hypothetical protein
MKQLKENAVYSDVVNGGYILPKKDKYTMKDFETLVNDGWDRVSAKFIVMCSGIYYHYDTKNYNCIEECVYNMEV